MLGFIWLFAATSGVLLYGTKDEGGPKFMLQLLIGEIGKQKNCPIDCVHSWNTVQSNIDILTQRAKNLKEQGPTQTKSVLTVNGSCLIWGHG